MCRLLRYINIVKQGLIVIKHVFLMSTRKSFLVFGSKISTILKAVDVTSESIF